MQTAWGKHQEVVNFFLKEIPDKADGTNKLGVTFNLADREGWIDGAFWQRTRSATG
tara:strand:+ start:2195 stop:2362 length:168 start_codon:yes stop_codon:yes gene_type:complete